MTYQIVTVPAARKSFKKLPGDVRKQLIGRLKILQSDPNRGELLERPWQTLRPFHTTLGGVQYRVVYEIDPRQQCQQLIIIRYAAIRENFHKELRRMKLKPLAV
ncbi:MAG: hypothetical protein K8F30_09075 [Taibaiella sp.]|nr:hypothetical protein [Taibaiella sp.]